MSFQTGEDCIFKEDCRQLTMGQRESPQTQIGSSVRDGSQDELNRLDQLMNHDIREGTMVTFILRLFSKEIFHSVRAYEVRVLLGSPVIFLVVLLILNLLKKFFWGSRSSLSGNQSLLVVWLLLKRNTLLIMDIVMVSSMSMGIQFFFQNQRLR